MTTASQAGGKEASLHIISISHISSNTSICTSARVKRVDHMQYFEGRQHSLIGIALDRPPPPHKEACRSYHVCDDLYPGSVPHRSH